MTTVIGVRFRHGGKVYDFQPGSFQIQKGDYVVVETARGVEYGYVAHGPRVSPEEKLVQPIRTILRKATAEDAEHAQNNIELEKKAMEICREKIAAHGLEMKLIDAEYTFDGNKLLFYFTADGRVDFRELVKDLASVFKTRIELRQIGVRDEAKACPSIGICGRPFCCQTFLPDFIPVSIKMAKDQNLSLNPTKISGSCGRLMCCLKYEESTYENLSRKLPSEGDLVRTPNGVGEVLHVNVLRELLKVGVRQNEDDDIEIAEYPLEDVTILRRRHSRSLDAEDFSESTELQEEHEPAENAVHREHRERHEHFERRERPERREREESGKSVSEKNEYEEHAEHTERSERMERGDRSGRAAHPERGEHTEHGPRGGRREHRERSSFRSRNHASERNEERSVEQSSNQADGK